MAASQTSENHRNSLTFLMPNTKTATQYLFKAGGGGGGGMERERGERERERERQRQRAGYRDKARLND